MIKVFAETTITDLMVEEGRIAGAFGYFRDTGRFVLFEVPAVVPDVLGCHDGGLHEQPVVVRDGRQFPPVAAPLASIAARSWEITRIRWPWVSALGGDRRRPRPGGCRLGRGQAEVGA